MKVIEKGTGQKGWSTEVRCTGRGNGGGGCDALLRVEQGDLFKTYSNARDETTTYITFKCCECGVLNDVEGVPSRVTETLPSEKDKFPTTDV